MPDQLSASIARTLRDARDERGLSISVLAQRSDVSRAMIARNERCEAQPTAALLGRLSGALGVTLSQLLARAEGDGRRLARGTDQPIWVDPDTGYRRRSVSPSAGGPLELVEVELPAGARVAYPADSYAFVDHQIWVLDGTLRFHEGDAVHDLDAGDCLALGAPQPCTYANVTDRPCRYLVALSRKR